MNFDFSFAKCGIQLIRFVFLFYLFRSSRDLAFTLNQRGVDSSRSCIRDTLFRKIVH